MRSLLFSIALVLALPGWGQQAPSQSQRNLPETILPPELATTPPPQVQPLPSPVTPPSTPTGREVTVQIDEINFLGNTVLGDREIRQALGSYAGSNYSFAQLQTFATKVEAFYRQRGYLIARAYLPEQRLNNKKLLIQIVEGVCEKVNVTNNSHISSKSIAAPFVNEVCSSGETPRVFSLKDLERAMLISNDLLLSDLGSFHNPLTISMSQGQKVGGTELNLNIKDPPVWRAYIGGDNMAGESAGNYQGMFGLDINSPISDGDRLALRGNISQGVYKYSGDYSYLMAYNGWRLGANYSISGYKLKDFSGINGDSTNYGIYSLHPLIREPGNTLSLRGDLSLNNFQDIDNVGTTKKKDVTLLRVGLDGVKPWLGGRLQYSANVTFGHLSLDALGKQDDSINKTEGGFGRFNYNVNFAYPLTNDLSGVANLSGQYAQVNLDSSQKLSLSGSSSTQVRGFNGEGTVDLGGILNSELRYRLSEFGGFGVTLSTFIDVGIGEFNASPHTNATNSITLSGWGVGFLIARAGLLSVSASYAMPISSSPKVSNSKSYTRVQAILLF